MNIRPDTQSAIAGLKDFQRATVDYVFKRFFEDPDRTRRFLVADEVGLGKTLIARGVIAKTIDHLWESVERIDVIYVCSNADIARQNIQRLGLDGCNAATQSTRLTLLPLQLKSIKQNRVNFIALTPATSFDQHGYGGTMDERALLYWLLDEAWGIHRSRKSINVLRDHAGVESFERRVSNFNKADINQDLAKAFVRKLADEVNGERLNGKANMLSRFEELQNLYCRSDSEPGREANSLRSRWIGELRRLLARVCLHALEPDLIIFDEFQRFSQLLSSESEAGQLAQTLFNSDAGHGARLLLLSATPYKSLSLHHENDDDQSSEFARLLSFLENGPDADCSQLLGSYRAALRGVRTPEGMATLKNVRNALRERLSKVMARTEKFGHGSIRNSMLKESVEPALQLRTQDVRAFLGAQEIAKFLEQGDVIEYWKSSPYLFNFMDTYVLKSAFKEAGADRELIRLVQKYGESFLPVDKIHAYQPIEPANARLRSLMEDTLDRGMWRLLWLPPALNYYEPSGPFANPAITGATKRLIFSAWHMVPRTISSLLSYEAERRMMRASAPRGTLTTEDWRKQRGLLRFGISAERLTGMPLMGLVYPCLTFARECDPREIARSGLKPAAAVKEILREKVRTLTGSIRFKPNPGGSADDRWYWLVPMLLDCQCFPKPSQDWWKRPDLANEWSDSNSSEEDKGWLRHVNEAKRLLEGVRLGLEALGPQPEDLFEVLALIASAGPATAALRGLCRGNETSPEACPATRLAAARTGRAFLTLFNHAEVTEMVRAEFPEHAYWRRVLDYCYAGQIQAMLDEYSHLLTESLGVASKSPAEIAAAISSEIIDAVTLRAASLHVDRIEAPPYSREVKVSSESMRIRFAMRFGDERKDEEILPLSNTNSPATRKERVRGAFNSPFWPFILVSTSVGQEGLDFHHYCHAITHWNLPSNPVDLEQREGRIHRYKGHAIRKNLATAHGGEALNQDASDPWKNLFAQALSTRNGGGNDLVPYWHFPGAAGIERHVPSLPFSREIDRFTALRKALTMYRMVFGQSRQEDLISYLLKEIPEADHLAIVTELQINLSPAGRMDSPAGCPDGSLIENRTAVYSSRCPDHAAKISTS